MSDSELVNIFDDNGNLIGSMSRKQAEAENLRSENVVVLVYTHEGKLWMQQRALYKSFHPGMWDISVAGGAEAHEGGLVAAQRETLEEMGISPALRHVESLARDIPFGDNLLYRYTHLYVAETDEQPAPNKEVLSFKAWDVDQLLAEMDTHPQNYIPNMQVLVQKTLNSRDTKNPSS
jgi:isopentenyl-diphosphate Delta-isomerase